MPIRKDRLRMTVLFKKRTDITKEAFERYLLNEIEEIKALPILSGTLLKFDYLFLEKPGPENAFPDVMQRTFGADTNGSGDYCVMVEFLNFELLDQFVSDPGFQNCRKSAAPRTHAISIHPSSESSSLIGHGGASPHITAIPASPIPITRPSLAGHPASTAASASVRFFLNSGHSIPPAPTAAAIPVPALRRCDALREDGPVIGLVQRDVDRAHEVRAVQQCGHARRT
ncbi:hypothetical protein MKEN_00015900 [Mycena kentingensis (nom. inval.)]|nr:hypothetical protein MKEN_00015900 [Mycena kentingensis (nom. inval.)]